MQRGTTLGLLAVVIGCIAGFGVLWTAYVVFAGGTVDLSIVAGTVAVLSSTIVLFAESRKPRRGGCRLRDTEPQPE